ncbi:MAG: thiazole synthase [Planctomycetes bacterium]|nr:thiazole synthase [Planctomycetota bacterium]MCB9910903.1 thiazole synthase [Planctomycetota bacterium]MCB9912114.1 thiazole synthase [Planctomycetota bacterium]
MGGELPLERPLVLGGRTFSSRLLVGTGKYASHQEMKDVLALSGTQLVTVAIRRVNFDAQLGTSILDHLDRERYALLPNTAGCYTARDAVRTAMLARDLLQTDLVKLEVLGDPRTLLPDPVGTLEATAELARAGFQVLAYTSDDPRLAVRLVEAGAHSVMPAGSPIGSGRGLANPSNLRILRELVSVPMVVDAGIGTASHVAQAMELGADAVLLNSAIAGALDPRRMAKAMAAACEAGRDAYLAGRIPERLYANASSPEEGLIEEAGPAPEQRPQ